VEGLDTCLDSQQPIDKEITGALKSRVRVSTTETPGVLQVWSAEQTLLWEHGRGFISRFPDKDALTLGE
jgi:hypothetical protein